MNFHYTGEGVDESGNPCQVSGDIEASSEGDVRRKMANQFMRCLSGHGTPRTAMGEAWGYAKGLTITSDDGGDEY